MSEKHPERQEAKLNNKDLAPVLKGWDYEAGTINVRKINGLDGLPKLQMREPLGVLQMEMTGRPDGHKPHGFDSLLEYFEAELADHKRKNGNELGFHLTGSQCETLRDEADLYYKRYLSLFVLEEFAGVVRDTARNLRVLDLCGKFATEEHDRLVLEQFRPYLTMMNARAKASMALKERRTTEALRIVNEGLEHIKAFFTRFGQEEAFAHSNEVRILRRFAREIRAKLPTDPVARLQNQLEKAVKGEQYERAAKLRDEIEAMRKTHRPSAKSPKSETR